MNELAAAMGLEQLKKLDKFNSIRRKNCGREQYDRIINYC